MPSFKTTLLGTAAVALATAAFAAPAAAQDANVVRSTAGDKVQVKITGQINRAVTFVDDGTDTNVNHVDNDISSSRFRIHADGKVTNDFSIGGIFELEVQPNASNNVNQDSDDQEEATSNTLMDRRVEVFFTSKKFGRVYMGKGPTASDGSSESDASAAGVIGSGGLNPSLFSGFNFRDGTGANVTSIDAVMTNYDGLSRANRVRYDTPVIAGFQGRASHINGGAYDAALFYNGALMGFKIEAAAAYWNASSNSGLNGYNGSLSVLSPIGIFATISGAKVDANDARDPIYYYADVGYQQKFFELGTTAIKLAYHFNEDEENVGDEAKMYQIGLVQHIDAAATELFVTYNHFELDRNGANPDDVDGIGVGARIKF